MARGRITIPSPCLTVCFRVVLFISLFDRWVSMHVHVCVTSVAGWFCWDHMLLLRPSKKYMSTPPRPCCFPILFCLDPFHSICGDSKNPGFISRKKLEAQIIEIRRSGRTHKALFLPTNSNPNPGFRAGSLYTLVTSKVSYHVR